MSQDSKTNIWLVCKKERTLLLCAIVFAIVVSLVQYFSIPKTYHSSVKIAIETSDEDITDNFLIASHLLNLGYPEEPISSITHDPFIYQKILSSDQFINQALAIKLPSPNGEGTINYRDSLEKHCKHPWWAFLERKKTTVDMGRENIKHEVDLHTAILTLQATAQSPSIAEILVDSVVKVFEAYLIEYKSKKSGIHAQHLKNIRADVGKTYHQAMKEKIDFEDTNFDLSTPTERIWSTHLDKEANRTLNTYSMAAINYKLAQIKEQQSKPSFVCIARNGRSTSPSAPNLPVIMVVWLFYSLLFTTWWVLLRNKFIHKTD